MNGTSVREYPEDWETNGRRDPLRPADRASIAPWSCDRCGAMLLSLEVGPHYRTRHPEDAPRVSRR
jgi:hypothetical protein